MYTHINGCYPFQNRKLRKLITHFNDANHFGSSSLWIDFSNWHNIFWKAIVLTKHHSFWRWISSVDRIKHHLELNLAKRKVNKNAPFLIKNEMWLWSIDQMFVLWNQAGPQSLPASFHYCMSFMNINKLWNHFVSQFPHL